MEIYVRGFASRTYKEVTLSHGDTQIKLGMLNKEERLALARTLEEAVDDLTDGLDKEEAA